MTVEQGLEAGNQGCFLGAAGAEELKVEIAGEVRGPVEGVQACLEPAYDAALGALRKVEGDDPNGRLPWGRADGLDSAAGDKFLPVRSEVVGDEHGGAPAKGTRGSAGPRCPMNGGGGKEILPLLRSPRSPVRLLDADDPSEVEVPPQRRPLVLRSM